MSINETIGLTITGDASGLTAEVKKATDAVGKLGDKAEEAKGKHEGLFSAAAEGLEKFNFAVEGAKKILEGFKEVAELVKFSAELENLEKRIPTSALQAMQKATEGTVQKTALLQFGMRALHGEFHLTEQGLETVTRAAQNLHDQGFGPTVQIADQLVESLRRGSTRGLAQYGIAVDEAHGKQQKLNETLEAFKRIAESESPVNENLKQIEKAEAAWADFVASMKQGLGEIVGEIARGIALLTGMVEWSKAEKLQQAALAKTQERTAGGGTYTLGQQGLGVFGQFATQVQESQTSAFGAGEQARRAQEMMGFEVQRARALAESVQAQAWEDAKAMLGGAAGGVGKGGPLVAGRLPGGGAKRYERVMGGEGRESVWNERELGFLRSAYGGFFGGATEGAGIQAEPTGPLGTVGGQFFGGAHAGVMAIGEDQRLQEALKDRTSAVGGAFDALSQGISASVEAAISGSDAIGKAFMKASAAALKALAVEATTRAAFELAMGLGGIAIGSPTAGAHFAAAAQYGIAAALAGAGAVALGAGAGGGAAGASPSTPAGGGYAGGSFPATGPQGQTIQVFVGDGYVGRPDELARALGDVLNHGTSTGRVRIVSSPAGAVSFKQ